MKPGSKVKFHNGVEDTTGVYVKGDHMDDSRIVVLCDSDNRQYCIDRPKKKQPKKKEPVVNEES